MNILVTGASGFVGGAVCNSFRLAGHDVRPVVRLPNINIMGSISVGDIDARTQWMPSLPGATCVVHCAARVHVMRDKTIDPLGAFRQVNVAGTLRLAEQAVAAGVKRFVYLSSLKVLGEENVINAPFQAVDKANPKDPYGQSKWEAEQALHDLSSKSGLEIVIIRPPLVYGPRVKANFLRLLQAVARGIPLPFGAVHNLRSLLALDNLCDLVRVCVEHPEAAGQTFLASDDQDIATPDLIRAIAQAMDRPARLLPVPVSWLEAAGRLTGKQAQIGRITGSLQVDIGHTKEVLGWVPRVTLQEQLKSVVQQFRL